MAFSQTHKPFLDEEINAGVHTTYVIGTVMPVDCLDEERALVDWFEENVLAVQPFESYESIDDSKTRWHFTAERHA